MSKALRTIKSSAGTPTVSRSKFTEAARQVTRSAATGRFVNQRSGASAATVVERSGASKKQIATRGAYAKTTATERASATNAAGAKPRSGKTDALSARVSAVIQRPSVIRPAAANAKESTGGGKARRR